MSKLLATLLLGLCAASAVAGGFPSLDASSLKSAASSAANNVVEEKTNDVVQGASSAVENKYDSAKDTAKKEYDAIDLKDKDDDKK